MPIPVIIAASSRLTARLVCRAFNQGRKHFKIAAAAHARKDVLEEFTKHQPALVLICADLENHPAGDLPTSRRLSLIRSSARLIVVREPLVSERTRERSDNFCLSHAWRGRQRC